MGYVKAHTFVSERGFVPTTATRATFGYGPIRQNGVPERSSMLEHSNGGRIDKWCLAQEGAPSGTHCRGLLFSPYRSAPLSVFVL